jgi:hypothetical protein
MTESKDWAYREATGPAWVSARSLAQERDELYGGKPTGDIYWSRHKEGHRLRMKHVLPKDGRVPHFSLINPGDEHLGGPGESLEHMLFKEAVASITHTRLSLGKFGDYHVQVTHAATEKEIPYAGGQYFTDVYLRFESPDSDLGMKWSGEVCIEILNTHAVEAEKMDNIIGLRVPMIEVPIPEELLYQYGGAQNTEERADAYRRRIKRMLESPNGFLKGIVLSDPSSAEYLERELADTKLALAAAQMQTATLQQGLASANSTIETLRAKGSEAASEVVRLRQREGVLTQQVAAHRVETSNLRSQLDAATFARENQTTELEAVRGRFGALQTQANGVVKKLRKTKATRNVAAWVAGLSLVALMVLLCLRA